MRTGAAYPQTELKGDPEAIGRFGTAVESLGYDHILAFDHVVGAEHANREPKLTRFYNEKDPFHDPFTFFSYLAALTKRIEFATGILVLPQRQTVLVAKQAADVDLLSRGRLRLGLGTGWNHVEYQALGQDFKTRGRRLDEQIKLLRKLWTEPLVSFHGDFDRIERGSVLPHPRRPIPIWIGGHSDAAYRRAAELGQGFIFSAAADVEEAGTHLSRLTEVLAGANRNTAGFGKDILIRFGKTVPETVDRLERWRDLGGTHATVMTDFKGLKPDVGAHIDFIAGVKAKFT
jgi:probable F420-dependent oxidoreductase